ncbi:dTMP kinase [Anaeromyxobacter paludicola]|uniref:Thymidylate kinase n=1 Tax=Anaeromyxobacter paludicola TaxID=2918171 RepID=A0ABN6N6B6_9BACT|nr:dTMP kinase [Anaeromyxobacter paludicola]BDG07668.1 thymidylate kinase [Anaeromyxobacter paludicola]
MSRGRGKGAGRFLVLEGLDGSGTTTQAERLAQALRARGREVRVTAEPSRGPVGQQARLVLSGRLRGGGGEELDPSALALLFAADRLDHLQAEILPALARGADVVCDRYTLSSLAYQSITTGDMAWVAALNARARPPDLTLFLEVSPRTALARRYAASAEREIFEVPAFQRKVARAYRLALARVEASGERVAVVDGEGTPEAVTAALLESIDGLR